MSTLREALQSAAARFTDSDSPRLDTELLLCHVLGKPRSHLMAWPDAELTADDERDFLALVERRAAGEPVAHLLGEREFWSLPLKVTADTLIPRPDTELLVELALERLPRRPGIRMADLGTGTGAIALALASERPAAQVVATDISDRALAVARENARRLDLANVEFRQGAWLAPLADEAFDLIVTNPPYIPEDDHHLGEGDVRFEPRVALTAGPDGLAAIRLIAAEALPHLQPGGWLILEHGHDQGESVPNILEQAGFVDVSDIPDLAGNPRACVGRRPRD